MSEEKKSEYPECPRCEQAMVWSFAMSGCEYVCLPCWEGVPMWHGRPKLERSDRYMAEKKRKWSTELSIMARRWGGASCAICDDGSCWLCKLTDDKGYKFKILGKNLTKEEQKGYGL